MTWIRSSLIILIIVFIISRIFLSIVLVLATHDEMLTIFRAGKILSLFMYHISPRILLLHGNLSLNLCFLIIKFNLFTIFLLLRFNLLYYFSFSCTRRWSDVREELIMAMILRMLLMEITWLIYAWGTLFIWTLISLKYEEMSDKLSYP